MATDVTKIKFKLHMKDSFLACIAYQLKIEPKEEIGTACTNGFYIQYNPSFMDNLPLDQQIGVFAHECMHVALQHMSRGMEIHDLNSEIWNIACDYVVNYFLYENDFKLPKEALKCPSKFRGMTTEEVYRELMKNQEKGEQPDMPEDMKDLIEPDEEEKDPNGYRNLKDQLRKVLGTARTQISSKSIGGMCGEFHRAYDDLIKPKLPWERILRGFVNDTIKGDYSWRKPNRRYMDIAYLPSICDEEVFRNANVYIDTSGSVTEDMISKFISEVRKMHRDLSIKEIRLNAFSVGITDTHIIGENWIPPKAFSSRGGTEITEVIEDINRHRAVVSIVITDGYFYMDPIKSAKYPIIWCIYDNKSFKPAKGRVIEIPT